MKEIIHAVPLALYLAFCHVSDDFFPYVCYACVFYFIVFIYDVGARNYAFCLLCKEAI